MSNKKYNLGIGQESNTDKALYWIHLLVHNKQKLWNGGKIVIIIKRYWVLTSFKLYALNGVGAYTPSLCKFVVKKFLF